MNNFKARQITVSLSSVSGSPAYDSVRSLAYHDANVFLLCFKISDPISLYNIKNKWIGEIRKHRPDAPIILCGCQVDLRNDPFTIAHLSKTGRTPVSQELGLAICCEIEAVNYIETSARCPEMCEGGKNNLEAFELCALAAMKHNNAVASNNNNNNNPFKRSPSIHSSLSLFESTPSDPGSVFGIGGNSGFKRSPSTNSNLSLAANFKMPTLAFKRTSTASVTSLKSPSSHSTCSSSADQHISSEVKLLRTFSPEPSNIRIPPVISENETYHSPTPQASGQLQSFTQQQQHNMKKTRPSSLCCNSNFDPVQEHNNMLIRNTLMRSSQPKLQRPTTLFKSASPSPSECMRSPPRGTINNTTTTGFFSPGNDQRHFHPAATAAGNSSGFDSELSTPTSSICSNSQMVIKSPQMDVVSPNNAQIRQNGLSRRTSYRTHPKMAIPVATPMSPAGSEFSLDCSSGIKSPISNMRSMCQSPNSDSLFMQSIAEDSSSVTSSSTSPPSNIPIPVFDLKSPKIYESLKSHMSTCSQSSSSDGSQKMVNSDFSDSSSISYKAERALAKQTQDLTLDSPLAPVPDTEDPQVLGNLNFVSPKAGVYRPSSGRKAKHNCSIM